MLYSYLATLDPPVDDQCANPYLNGVLKLEKFQDGILSLNYYVELSI